MHHNHLVIYKACEVDDNDAIVEDSCSASYMLIDMSGVSDRIADYDTLIPKSTNDTIEMAKGDTLGTYSVKSNDILFSTYALYNAE